MRWSETEDNIMSHRCKQKSSWKEDDFKYFYPSRSGMSIDNRWRKVSLNKINAEAKPAPFSRLQAIRDFARRMGKVRAAEQRK